MLKLRISLHTFRENLRQVQQEIGNSGIILVAKANAYGLGAIELSRVAIEQGVQTLAVATVLEGKQLREAGIKAPILILSEPLDWESIYEYDLIPTVYTMAFLKLLDQTKKRCGIHIKVNTGMNRLGCEPEDFGALFEYVKANPYIQLKGVYSHFASLDDQAYSLNQVSKFQALIQKFDLKRLGICIHMANSGAVFEHPEVHFDQVRVGLFAYHNIATLSSSVLFCHAVQKGEKIGYEGVFEAMQDTVIATVFGGYADGIPTQLSNKGVVLIKGREFPIVGRVCMDMILVDLSKNDLDIQRGDEVFFLDNHTLDLQRISRLADKNPREFLTGIGARSRLMVIYE